MSSFNEKPYSGLIAMSVLLYLFISVCLDVCISICRSLPFINDVSISLSNVPPVLPNTHQTINPSVHQIIYPSSCLCHYISLNICLFVNYKWGISNGISSRKNKHTNYKSINVIHIASNNSNNCSSIIDAF